MSFNQNHNFKDKVYVNFKYSLIINDKAYIRFKLSNVKICTMSASLSVREVNNKIIKFTKYVVILIYLKNIITNNKSTMT